MLEDHRRGHLQPGTLVEPIHKLHHRERVDARIYHWGAGPNARCTRQATQDIEHRRKQPSVGVVHRVLLPIGACRGELTVQRSAASEAHLPPLSGEHIRLLADIVGGVGPAERELRLPGEDAGMLALLLDHLECDLAAVVQRAHENDVCQHPWQHHLDLVVELAERPRRIPPLAVERAHSRDRDGQLGERAACAAAEGRRMR